MTISKSFQDLHDELYLQGIKDVGFLVFTHPSVKGIDPFADDISIEDKKSVIREINNNFWYFLRDVVRCNVMGSTDLEQFRINKGSLVSLWLANNHCNVYSVLPWGSSNITSQVVWCLWKLITNPAYRCVVLDKSVDDSRIFVERIKMINRNLPDFIMLEDDYIDRTVSIKRSPENLHQAELIARGTTDDIYIINLENIKYIDVIMKTISPVIYHKKTKLYATSEIGEKGSYGKKVGDMISSNGIKWIDEMFDMKLNNKARIFYNSLPMTHLRPGDEVEDVKKLFGNDCDLIRRRVYMER